MDTSNDDHDSLAFDLERLLAAEASVEAGRYRPLRDAMADLLARLHV